MVNAPFLPFLNLTFKKLEMALPIIPGAPEKVRLFWQAYFWILVSSVLAFPFLKPTRGPTPGGRGASGSSGPRGRCSPRRSSSPSPSSSTTRGKNEAWQLVDPAGTWSMSWPERPPRPLDGSTSLVAPVPRPARRLRQRLGILGHRHADAAPSRAAEKIGAVGLLVAAASGIGGGLASVISPAKLQNAAASIDRIGEEAKVIPATFVIALIITGVCALLSLLWAF